MRGSAWLQLGRSVSAALALGCAERPQLFSPSPASLPVASAAPNLSAAPPNLSAAPPNPSAVDKVDFGARLSAFFGSMGDEAKRHDAYRALFAPRLARFIGLHDVPRDRAIAAADSFFAAKSNVSYGLNGAPKVTRDGRGTRVAARITAHYEAPVPAAWPVLVPELADATITSNVELTVELEATSDGVTSYVERDASSHRRMRVTTKTRGYELPFVDGCWSTPRAEVESVDLLPGTVLEASHESVLVYGCGPGTSVVHLRLHGKDWWVVLALYELVPNPAGGSSTGGTVFLDWAD